MQIITTKTDLAAYVGNANPAGVLSEGREVTAAAVDALASADGAPLWGQDWSEWLDANAERIVLGAVDEFQG